MTENPSSVPAKLPTKAVAGTCSGKRTLVEIMDHDIQLKRKKTSISSAGDTARASVSKFFCEAGSNSPASHSRSPSLTDLSTKENIDPFEAKFTGLDDVDTDPVEQEDGYLSPSPCFSRNLTPELSSPVTAFRHRGRTTCVDRNNHPIQAHSSDRHRHQGFNAARQLECAFGAASPFIEEEEERERILVRGSSELPENGVDGDSVNILGPDLRANFGPNDELIEDDEIDDIELQLPLECADKAPLNTPTPESSATPPTATQPNSRTDSFESFRENEEDCIELLIGEELDEQLQTVAARAKVAKGWSARFAFAGEQRTPTRKLGQVRSARSYSHPRTY